MVLVSKADLLGDVERRQTAEYVQRQLATQANLNLPVYLVSVLGESAVLCNEWLEKELMPLVEAHREQAAAALKRKVGGLREAVIKILESRSTRWIGHLNNCARRRRHCRTKSRLSCASNFRAGNSGYRRCWNPGANGSVFFSGAN